MKKIVALLIVLTASFSAFAQENKPKSIELTAQERQLVSNNNKFAYNLFSKIRYTQSSTLNYQPSSISSRVMPSAPLFSIPKSRVMLKGDKIVEG